MSITEQAKTELDAINFGEEDTAVMIAILDLFFSQWDSGGGVSIVTPILMRLINGLPLKPLTGEDSEWYDPAVGGVQMLQNVRCSTVFKTPDRVFDSNNDAWDGTFPYDPPTSLPSEPVYEIETETGEIDDDH